jgi:hypothetical protein
VTSCDTSLTSRFSYVISARQKPSPEAAHLGGNRSVAI